MFRRWLAANPLYDVVVVWSMGICSATLAEMISTHRWDVGVLAVIFVQFGLAVFGHLWGSKGGGE